MKNVVIYYSKSGSNDYLAKYFAKKLNCQSERIIPIINAQLLMMIGIGLGIKKLNADLSKYDNVILIGPVWMGKFIYPLKSFLKKYGNKINKLYFLTCCGSSFDKKNDKFGHELVFNQVKELFPSNNIHCEAFPITMVIPREKQEDGELVMKTRLNDNNFKGEILEKANSIIEKLN